MAEKRLHSQNLKTISQKEEDAEVMLKVRRIVQKGESAEIKQDSNGKLKVYEVSKSIA